MVGLCSSKYNYDSHFDDSKLMQDLKPKVQQEFESH